MSFPPSPFVTGHALDRFRDRAKSPKATVADVLIAIRNARQDDSWHSDPKAIRHLLLKHGARQFRFLVDERRKVTFVLAESRGQFDKHGEVVLTCYEGTIAGGRGRSV